MNLGCLRAVSLRDLAVVGQREAIFSALFGDLPWISTIGVPGVDLIEPGPNQLSVVEIKPAGDGDLRAGREQHLVVGSWN